MPRPNQSVARRAAVRVRPCPKEDGSFEVYVASTGETLEGRLTFEAALAIATEMNGHGD